MRIPALSGALAPSASAPSSSKTGDFADAFGRAVSELSRLQGAADRAAESVAVGDLSHLHEAVLAVQRAALALDLAVAVRNHVVDAVNELLRTQV
jgi:flagellar hook-basal body complex protein FliE